MKKKFYFKKRGFTLIELLAVIVILAIILLVVMPIVINVINDARKGAFEASAMGLVKTAENACMTKKLNNNVIETTYLFNDGVQTTNPIGESNLEFSGSSPADGYIQVYTDCTVEMGLLDGTYYVSKERNENVNKAEDYTGTGQPLEPVVVLPDTVDITYINDPTEPDYPLTATPCLIGGSEFTHILDKRDSKPYPVTKIGDQCWMAENLAYTTTTCLNEEWQAYDVTTNPYPSACLVNGGIGWDQNEVLYQWGAAMDGDGEGGQGLCPVGWYIPTDDEWVDLERAVCNHAGNANCETTFPYGSGNSRGTDEGQRLKSTSPNWDGTNAVGFSGLPAGFRFTSGGNPFNVGSDGYWWSSSPSSSDAWRRSLHSGDSDVLRGISSQAYGNSVRCVLGP